MIKKMMMLNLTTANETLFEIKFQLCHILDESVEMKNQ
jgi:hypothetical protein